MPAPRMTTDVYLRTPETVAPQELVYGIVRDCAAPTPGHQYWVAQLFLALAAHLDGRAFARIWFSPIDVVLDRKLGLVVQPDLIVIVAGRYGMVTDRVWGAPDLVIEVLSPDPRIGDLEERVAWFAEYGVRECWLVNQFERRLEIVRFAERQIAARSTIDEHTPIASTVLPDFSRTIADIVGPRDVGERFRISNA